MTYSSHSSHLCVVTSAIIELFISRGGYKIPFYIHFHKSPSYVLHHRQDRKKPQHTSRENLFSFIQLFVYSSETKLSFLSGSNKCHFIVLFLGNIFRDCWMGICFTDEWQGTWTPFAIKEYGMSMAMQRSFSKDRQWDKTNCSSMHYSTELFSYQKALKEYQHHIRI